MTIFDFEKYTDRTIFNRGMQYWQQGRVSLVGEEDGCYYFDVEGSDVYAVDIEVDADGKVTFYSCDCPYGDPLCKHVVACLLELRENLMPSHKDVGSGLDEMPEHNLAYLYYLAYSRTVLTSYATTRPLLLPSSQEKWLATLPLQKNMAGTLERQGWLTKLTDVNAFAPKRLVVNPRRVLAVLIHMYRNHHPWLQSFNALGRRELDAVVISYLAQYLVEGKADFDALRMERLADLSSDMRSILWDAISIDEQKALPLLLPQWLLSALLAPELDKMRYSGDISSLDRVYQVMESIPDKSVDLLQPHASLRMLWFYAKGQSLPSIPGEEAFADTHFMNAAVNLCQGNADEALIDFRKGFQIQSQKLKAWSDIPVDPLSTFLYICALCITNSPDKAQALAWLKTKLSQKYKSNFRCFELLISKIEGRRLNEMKFSMMLWANANPLELLLNQIVYIFAFGSEERNVLLNDNCPRVGILLNEFYVQKGISPVDFEWRGAAILPRIPLKEAWEAELSDLISIVAPRSSPTASEERVIYYCKQYSKSIEVRLQGKLKSGGYSRGKVLSASRYSSGDCPMDDTDVAIHQDWKRSGYGITPSLENVLPHCVGKDKLFTDTGFRDFTSVQVIEEKPYVTTVRSGGKITFCSNVPEDVMSNTFNGLHYKWLDDCATIKFWPMGDAEARVLKGLMQLKSVPQEAEPMLESLFKPLQGRLEVQSDVKGGVQLEKREGNSTLCVRVIRSGELFHATFLSRPLDGGSVYLVPGKGDVSVIDSNIDGRFEVIRNLKKEKKNLKSAMSLLGANRQEDSYISSLELLYALENPSSFEGILYFEWPKDDALRLNKPDSSAFQVTAVGKGGWFELEGELKVSEDFIISIADLLSMSRAGNRYIKLGENEYLFLSSEIRRQLGCLDSVAQTSHGKLTVPQLAMTVLSDNLGDVVDVAEEQALLERKTLIREASRMDFAVPDGLNAVLRPYQEDGYRWLCRLAHWHAGACLADDMGLGKTVQTIAFMLARTSNGPQLVVAPTSVLFNWESELRRFAPSLKVVVINAMVSAERNEFLLGKQSATSVLAPGQVVLSTYGILAAEAEAFAGPQWESVILDEAHTIKNRDTKMSSAAMGLRANNRVILTGTPIQNHLGELWNLFRFINPGLLGSYDHFQEIFVSRDSEESRDALRRLVSPFMLRRTKSEVVRELPEKTEIILPVEMNDCEKAVYEVIRREARRELEDSSIVSVNALAMMTKLRMASCSASLVEADVECECSKLDVFVDKLQSIVEQGNNVLVFSQFTSFLSLARDVAKKAGIKKILYLDGSTTVAKRQKMVEEFQRGEVPVFFISLKAGGLGLNLTGANYVIHLDPWWNPAIEQQATDRAYRIGQQQNVTVYHLISSGTIEEKILRLHNTKRQLADAILNGSSASSKLSAEDILELIS